MPARTPSTFRLIGAGVTSVGALAAIIGAGGSNAQTLANLETDRAAYLESKCGRIADHAKAAGCYAEESIKLDEARAAEAREREKAANAKAAAARKSAAEHRAATEAIEKKSAADTAAHQRAIAEIQKERAEIQKAAGAARTEAQCLSDISKALTANPPRITPADVRAAKTTPTPSDDACVWHARLAPRLSELTKQ